MPVFPYTVVKPFFRLFLRGRAPWTPPETAWAERDETLASYQTAGLRYPENGMKDIDATE